MPRIYQDRYTREFVVRNHREAAVRGINNGSNGEGAQMYLDMCQSFYHYINGERCHMGTLFTRDEGHHTCGWWKNPDYERCEHLSLSFWEHPGGKPLPRDPVKTKQFIELFFGDYARLVWAEGPSTEFGKTADIWHYRVFYAPDWKTPILPRGEVYTKEFTEAGWLSSSANQARIDAEIEKLRERLEDG